MVTLAKRIMSDTELRHRKKLQAVASRGTATTGLTSLALLGASGVASRKGAHGAAQKLRNASLNTGIVGSGLSGVAGFNFARIQSEEAKKPRPAVIQPKKGTLVKRDGISKIVVRTPTKLVRRMSDNLPRKTRDLNRLASQMKDPKTGFSNPVQVSIARKHNFSPWGEKEARKRGLKTKTALPTPKLINGHHRLALAEQRGDKTMLVNYRLRPHARIQDDRLTTDARGKVINLPPDRIPKDRTTAVASTAAGTVVGVPAVGIAVHHRKKVAKRDRGTPVVSQISAARAVRTANRLEDPARAKRLAAHLAKVPTSAKGPIGQRVVYYKAVAGNRDVRLVRPTADRWSRTFKGVTAIKNADSHGRQDAHQILHHPLKARDTADNRIVRSIARNAPRSDKPLHRVTFVRVGSKEPVGHRTPSSWTPDERVARNVADYQRTRNRRNAEMARRTKLVPKVSRTFQRRVLQGELHLVTKPEGMRAMNLSAATPRFRQSERVAVTHVRAQHATPLSKKKQQGWVLKPRKEFDSEKSRDRREKGYGRALAAGSGAAAGGAAYQGAQAARKGAQGLVLRQRSTNQIKRAEGAESFARKARGVSDDIARRKKGEAVARRLYNQAARGAEKHAALSRTYAANSAAAAPRALRAAGSHGLKGAGLAAGAVALAGGAKAVTSHRQHGGRTYNGWWEHRY